MSHATWRGYRRQSPKYGHETTKIAGSRVRVSPAEQVLPLSARNTRDAMLFTWNQ